MLPRISSDVCFAAASALSASFCSVMSRKSTETPPSAVGETEKCTQRFMIGEMFLEVDGLALAHRAQ